MAERLAAMAWPATTGLAGRYPPEGLLPPLQATSKVLLIEYQQGAVIGLLPLKDQKADLTGQGTGAVGMAQGQMGQLQVVGQLLGLPIKTARHS